MKNRLVIIGAGGHGKVCADIADSLDFWKEIIFLDDQKKGLVNGVKVHSTNDVDEWLKGSDFFVGIGDSKTREKTIKLLTSMQANIVNLIHPSAILSKHTSLNNGILIMPGCIINANVTIETGVIINSGSIVEHDSILKEYVHISPGACLAGNVQIGSHTWIGIGSTVINNINIASNTVIGAHSLVLNNINTGGVYFGVPIKNH